VVHRKELEVGQEKDGRLVRQSDRAGGQHK
jgi:hypothetical protein